MTICSRKLTEDLSKRQRFVMEKIIQFIQEKHYPPSIQQLCDACNVSSTSTIHHHLSVLSKKGFISVNHAGRRAITVHPDFLDNNMDGEPQEASHGIPLLGVIAAGQPLQTTVHQTETFNFSDWIPEKAFALRVRGLSMIDDHILDGDIVMIDPTARIKEGDIVVALVDGETATLKRIYHESDGRIRLQPANAQMEPIYVNHVEVQGKVLGVIRQS
jgi:repressor LexA